MDINLIRRFNLWVTAHPNGYSDQGVKLLAEKTGKSDQRIRHLIGKSALSQTAKNIGTTSARDFEKALNLPSGWMDHVHADFWKSRGINVAKFESGYLRDNYPKDLADEVNEGSNVHYDEGFRHFGRVPLISWVQAGEFCEAIDQFEPGDAERWLPKPDRVGGSTYALKVNGDSMTSPFANVRDYPEGTIIFVDPEQQVLPGQRGVFRLPDSNEVTFKELVSDAGDQFLKPLNPQYKNIAVTEGMVCCGKVVCSFFEE